MSPFSIYTAIFIIATILGGTGAWQVQGWRYGAREMAQLAALDSQKLQARAALAAETGKTAAAQQVLANTKNEQDLSDAKHQKANELLFARLSAAAGGADRLRDPSAVRRGCSCSGPTAAANAATSAGADDKADATGLLSADLTGLLLAQAKAADLINNAYTSCRADAESVRR